MHNVVMAQVQGGLKRYLLREYGSWGVMSLSFISGLVAVPRVSAAAGAAFISLALFINSKQALTVWMRSTTADRTAPMIVFLVQLLAASTLFAAVAGPELTALMPYAVVPAAYLLSLKLLGEHSIITEVLGFILLSLSSLVARFTAAGGIDARLFLAVALFFTAGVFRMRIQFRKEIFYRIVMVVYVLLAVAIYQAAGLPLLLLLPLADNLLFAVFLYRVGLSTTGWIEMTKGIAFTVLLACFHA